MKNLLIPLTLIVLFLINCKDTSSNLSFNNVNNLNPEKGNSTIPEVKMFVKKDNWENSYLFMTQVNLKKGNYLVSPHSTDTTYGHFKISWDDSSTFRKNGMIQEKPVSILKFDSLINQSVRLCDTTTTFSQPIKIQSNEMRRTRGFVWFVHEPECIAYSAEFELLWNGENFAIIQRKTTALP